MASYEVRDTREISEMTPAGSRRTLYRVWIQTARGATGTVDVAADDWTSEKLPTILEAKAETLDLAYSVAG